MVFGVTPVVGRFLDYCLVGLKIASVMWSTSIVFLNLCFPQHFSLPPWAHTLPLCLKVQYPTVETPFSPSVVISALCCCAYFPRRARLPHPDWDRALQKKASFSFLKFPFFHLLKWKLSLCFPPPVWLYIFKLALVCSMGILLASVWVSSFIYSPNYSFRIENYLGLISLKMKEWETGREKFRK